VTTLALPFRVAPAVRHAEIDGLRVILDLDSASYRVLDHIGSAMWPALVGERPRSDVLAELTAAYDAPQAVLERDLERFGARCVAERLLLSPPDAEPFERRERTGGTPRRAVRWHWFAALRSLVATGRGIAREGLRPVYERCAGVPLGTRRIAFSRAVAAFLAAENVYVSARAPDDCLGRSLALYRYLRSAGFAVAHVIGVRRIPFRAHAWVEYEGDVVLDRPLDGYVALARLAGP